MFFHVFLTRAGLYQMHTVGMFLQRRHHFMHPPFRRRRLVIGRMPVRVVCVSGVRESQTLQSVQVSSV